MAAIIAALVSMVIRKDFFLTMEGNLKGAFALTCVAIWNGCFNSIQSVCRERPIIKREHRSGMHISSYVASHMIYQFALCLAQTGLSVYAVSYTHLFYVTNTDCAIELSGVALTLADGCLLRVEGNTGERGWGTPGENGGRCTLNAIAQALSGTIRVDESLSLVHI